jgi:hypothetical protein
MSVDEITGLNNEVNWLKIDEVKDDALVDIVFNSVLVELIVADESVEKNVDMVVIGVEIKEDEVKVHGEKDCESAIMDEVDETLASF